MKQKSSKKKSSSSEAASKKTAKKPAAKGSVARKSTKKGADKPDEAAPGATGSAGEPDADGGAVEEISAVEAVSAAEETGRKAEKKASAEGDDSGPRVSVPPPIPPRARPSVSGDRPPGPPRVTVPPPIKPTVKRPPAAVSENEPTLLQLEEDDAVEVVEDAPIPAPPEPEDSELDMSLTVELTDDLLETLDSEPPKPGPAAPPKPVPTAPPKPVPTAPPKPAVMKRPPATAAATPKPSPAPKPAAAPRPSVAMTPEPTLDISAEIPPPTPKGAVSLPPEPPKKTPRPSPELLRETVRKAAAAKASKGVTGPGGDSMERAKSVIAACEAEITPKTEKSRAARLHFEMAQCYELFVDDEAKAMQHYLKTLELQSDFLPAIRGARRLQIAQKQYPAALKLLDAEIELEGDPRHKALLHCVKGRIYEDYLHQQTKARQSYQKALESAPGIPSIIDPLVQLEIKAKNWPGTIELLAQAADAVPTDAEFRAALIAERARLLDTRTKNSAAAAEAYAYALQTDPDVQGVRRPLKRLLYLQSRWQDLAALWERDIAASEDPEARAAALVHVSRIYADRLGDRAKAVETLERAHHIAPTNLQVLEALASHYEWMQAPDRLIDVLKRTAELVPADHRRAALLHRIGTIYDKTGADPVQAVSWYEEALRLQPAHIPALRAATGLYEQLGRWEALASVYLGEISGTDNAARRAEAHVKAAEIFEIRLNRPQDAVTHHVAAMVLVPGLESSFKALVRLYSQARMYKPLIELYESAADRTKDEDTLYTYLFKIGALYEDALGRPDLALDVYRRVLARSPRHLGAIHAMQRTAEASGRLNELVEALQSEAEIVKDPARRVEILQAAARTADEKLQDGEAALALYKQVLEADATYPPALSGIGRLYYRLERWPELLDIYGRELKGTEDTTQKVSLLTKMAELCAYHMGDEDGAVKYYRQAVDAAPEDALLRHSLCSRLEHKGDFDALVSVLNSALEQISEPVERARLAVRIGEIHESNRKDAARAAEAFTLALEETPACRPALDGLLRVQGALGEWSELAKRLLRDAEATTDVSASMEALLQAAVISGDHLNDTASAVSALEGVLVKDPTNVAALLYLAPLLRETGEWEKLIEVYARLAGVVTDPGERIALFKESARLLEMHGETAQLKQALVATLAGDPRDPAAIGAMEQLGVAKKDWPLLAEADLHSVSAAVSPELAAVYLARLGHAMESATPTEAIEAFRAASLFDTDGVAALRAMAVLGEKLGDADTQIQALKQESDWTDSSKKAAELLVRSADLKLRLKRDFSGAVGDLAAALYRHPENDDAVARLTEMLTETEHIRTLVEVLSRAADMTRDGTKKAEYWGMVAELRNERLGDLSGAISALKRMLTAQPTHVPTLMRLSDLYQRNRQWEEAVKTLERAAKQRPNRSVLSEIYLESARIAKQHLKNAALAVSSLESLLQLEPAHVEALTLLCEAHFHSGKLEAAAAAAEKLLKAAKTDEERAVALLSTGTVRFKKSAKKSAAKFFRDAISLAGLTGSASPEYRSMLGKEEPWEAYLGALTAYRDKAASDPKKAAELPPLVSEIARVRHEGLGDPAGAVAELEKAAAALGDLAELRFALAERLAAAKQYRRAAGELLRLTAEAPYRPEYWRLLAQVYRADGQERRAATAAAPLYIVPGGKELLPFEPDYGVPGRVAAGSVSRSIPGGLTPRLPGVDAMLSLFSTLTDAAAKLYPPSLESYGLSTRDKLAESHPLHRLCAAMGTAFGVPTFDLYVSAICDDMRVELTQPVSIIVPERLRTAGPARQVFAAGRLFSYLVQEQQALYRIGPAQARLTAAAMTYKFSTALAAGFDTDTLERESKRIYKAVSWRSKKTVEEAAAMLASVPGLDAGACLSAVETAAVRVGAILAYDLASVSEELARILSDRAKHEAAIGDLLSFWASEPADAVRRAVKIL